MGRGESTSIGIGIGTATATSTATGTGTATTTSLDGGARNGMFSGAPLPDSPSPHALFET